MACEKCGKPAWGWPVPPFPSPENPTGAGHLEIRECTTLGTNFCDIWCDGFLFAREVSRPVADLFLTHWMYYANAFTDEARLRTLIIERGDAEVFKRYGNKAKEASES